MVAQSDWWDSALIDARSAQDVYEAENTYDTTIGVAYSYNGDYVCQSDYETGRQIWRMCLIKVVNQNFVFTRCDRDGTDCRSSKGVRAHSTDGSYAAQNGDSGDLVYCYCAGQRQMRGQISAVRADPSYVDWVEARDILGHYG